jgi:hypothetical protein
VISDGGDGKNEIALGLLYFVSWIRRCAALTKLVVIVRDPEHRLLGRFVAHPLGQDAGFFGSMAPMVWVIEMRSIGHGANSTSLDRFLRNCEGGAAPRAARAAPARDCEPIGEPRVEGQLLSQIALPQSNSGATVDTKK